ncbi:MAG: HTH domain-containing protein [Pleomorphochaeta sp.]
MRSVSPNERQKALIELLCYKCHGTYKNLAQEFGVSKRTIRYDIEILTLSYPIETVSGRYGGGVKIADWYHLNRKTLTLE